MNIINVLADDRLFLLRIFGHLPLLSLSFSSDLLSISLMCSRMSIMISSLQLLLLLSFKFLNKEWEGMGLGSEIIRPGPALGYSPKTDSYKVTPPPTFKLPPIKILGRETTD